MKLGGGGWSGHWCGLSKKKKKIYRRKWRWESVTFSLSGFKCTHILQQSPPLSRVPRPKFFCPQNVEQPWFLDTNVPSSPLCAQVWPLFLFCFLLALTSNHLTRNEWMNVWKWLCVMLKLGNVFLQHVNMFFFHSLSLWIDFFSFTRLQKQTKKRKKKTPVTRLLSFIFVFVYFFIRNNHVCDGNFQW